MTARGSVVALAVALALVLGFAARIAGAQPADVNAPRTPSAQARLEAGTQAFVANDFATASTEFAAGYAAEPWSGFLFAWAQSERRRGDCAAAVKLYTRFIATSPPPEVRQLAEDGVAACGGATPRQPPKPPEPTEPIEEPPPEVTPPVVTPPPLLPGAREDRPFAHKLALGFAAGALVAGGVGVVYYVSSRNAAEEADRAPTHPEAVTLYDRAKSKRLVAQISGGIGIGLAAASVLRYVLHRGDSADDDAIAISPAGAVMFTTRW